MPEEPQSIGIFIVASSENEKVIAKSRVEVREQASTCCC